MSFANHTLVLDPRVARVAPLIGMGLSSITVVSVCVAVFKAIDSLPLAIMFAAGAAMLDVFKYLAWPLAAALFGLRRWAAASLLVVLALVMGGLSAGSTYKLLMDPVNAARADHQARQQRIVDLDAARADDARVLDGLAADVAAVRAAAAERRSGIEADASAKALQADALRGRGMATPARQLEESTAARLAAERAQVSRDEAYAIARLDARREQLRERLERGSLELAELRAVPVEVTAESSDAAALFALWFGLALEVVPAMIMVVLRPAPSAAHASAPAPVALEAVDVAPETAERAPETLPETVETLPADAAAGPAERGDNAELLQKLLEQTAETPAGKAVTLREFAKAHKVGPHRAGLVFRMAVEAGRLMKTESARYVVCGNSTISDCANSRIS